MADIPNYGTLESDLLLTGKDSDLDHAVADALHYLGFFVFEPWHSKADMIARGDKSRLRYSKFLHKRVKVTHHMTFCVVEVKSSTKNIYIDSPRQLADWCDSEMVEVAMMETDAIETWIEQKRHDIIPRLKGVSQQLV